MNAKPTQNTQERKFSLGENTGIKMFKRVFSALVALSIIICAVSLSAFAENGILRTDDTANALYSYNEVEDGVEICGFNGNPAELDGELDVPSEIDGKTVAGIAENAFYKCVGVKKIALPDTVKYIGNGACSGLTELQSVNIPASLDTIGKYVFNKCTALESISCDEENQYFSAENGVLYNKDKTSILYAPAVETVTIPETVTSIESYSFRMNCNITEITIPENVKSIGEGAFGDCSALKTVSVANGVQSIGKFAFYRCKSLELISLPETVSSIGDNALNSNDNIIVDCISGSFAQDYCIQNNIAVIVSARKPDAPKVSQILRGSVALEPTDGCEYSIDGENWQSDNVFYNLEPATDYTFYQRVAKTDDVLASEKSDGVTVKTLGGSDFIYGDANNDGDVNLLDLLLMRKHLAKWNVSIDTAAADCNADGDVNLLDLLLMRKYLVKWNVTLGPKPPVIETPDIIETPDVI